jgi:RHS repeat-associated protein
LPDPYFPDPYFPQQADGNTPVAYGYGYDGAKELLSATKTSGTATLDTYAYRYDAAGNRLGQQINKSVTSSAYNDLNQVTSVSGSGLLTISGSLSESGTVSVAGTSVLTDSNNNFTIVAPVVAGSNSIPITATHSSTSGTSKVLQVNVTSGTPIPQLQYDANGNLSSEITTYGTFSYTWDAANRLITVNEPSGLSSRFAYDGLGRRVQIIETGSNGIVTSTKNLIWDGMTIREERNAGNAVTKMYFHNSVQISGSNYYYTRDHLGSIREVTGTNGLVLARYDYDPYGQQTQLSGTVSADFGFTGLYYHQPSGLNLAPFRGYSPSLGRWISRDPMASPTFLGVDPSHLKPYKGVGELILGPNLYEYVGDAPIGNIDILGLCDLQLFLGPPPSDGDDASMCNWYWDNYKDCADWALGWTKYFNYGNGVVGAGGVANVLAKLGFGSLAYYNSNQLNAFQASVDSRIDASIDSRIIERHQGQSSA